MRAASRARAASMDLRMALLGLRRVLLEELGQAAVDGLLHEALDRRVAELGLGLALELRVVDLHRDDRGEPLADVLAREVGVLLLELALLARVGVDRARERGAEAREVGAALVRVDVVGEREQRLLVGVVPLHRDLDLADVGLVGDVDDLLVQRLARALAVQVVDEVDDAAVVLEAGLEALPALVGEVDPQALGEEGHLAEALRERVALVVDRLEDLEVGHELDARAVAVGLRALLQLALRRAALVGLGPLVAVAPDGELELLRQRVDHRDARRRGGRRRPCSRRRRRTCRRRAAPVSTTSAAGRFSFSCIPTGMPRPLSVTVTRVVRVDGDLDLVALAGQRLVDRVVHDLVDEVMEAADARRADVHAGALAHRLEALEDGDVLRPVAAVALRLVLLRQAMPSVGQT